MKGAKGPAPCKPRCLPNVASRQGVARRRQKARGRDDPDTEVVKSKGRSAKG